MNFSDAAPMLPVHESDEEETVVEVSSSELGSPPSSDPGPLQTLHHDPVAPEEPSSDFDPLHHDPVTPAMCAERYTSLVHIHRARPDMPMNVIYEIADCLSLPWHDDQWCLGLGMPVAAIPWGCSSSEWCLSGWILDPDDQERYRIGRARLEMPRSILLLGCRRGLPTEAMRNIFQWLHETE